MDNNLQRNILKALSVVFAFVMWIYVIGTADTQIEKTVNVRYVLPQNTAIASEDVKEVVFHLTGPRAFIRTIQDKEDFITIDLTKRKKRVRGKIEVKFKPTDINLPFGVKVTKMEPTRVYLEIEKAMIKKIPIKAITTGQLPRVQKMIYGRLENKFVQLQGPSSVIRDLESVQTMPIDISNFTGEGRVKVLPLMDDDRLTRIDADELYYSYKVKPTKANLVLKDIPIKFLTSKTVSKPEKRIVSLIVLSEEGDEDDINKDEIQVIAEIPDTARGKTMVELKATLPNGLYLIEIQPNKIFVYVN